MNTGLVTSIPSVFSKALLQGLETTKDKMPDDKVATTTQVGAPQVTPQGSPIAGQVAVPQGAPVEEFFKFIVDTSAYNDGDDVTAFIGDNSGVHASACNGCSAPANLASVYVGSQACDKYEAVINRLCSTPYTLMGVKVVASYTTGGAGLLELPEAIKWSRLNINEDGEHGQVFVQQHEDYGQFPRTDVKFATVPLTGKASLFDRDTKWTLNGLKGNRKYEVTVYVAFRKEN